MNQLRSIVVAVDFSACSRKALRHAVRIARWNEARLHLVHVIDGLVVVDLAEAVRAPLAEVQTQAASSAEHELQACLREAEGEGSVLVRIGSPIEEILKIVGLLEADLLLMGANGTSVPHMGAGTVAVQCLRKAPTKVLLVGLYARESFRTIAAAVDFSETSSVVVEQARRVAACEDSAVHCVHVYDPPWNKLHYLVPTSEANPDFRTQYMAALQGRLETFVGAKSARTCLNCTLFPHPRFGTGIAEYARQIGADLIVLGAHGRTNLRNILLGTTAERLLRDLPCSVLAVRAATGGAHGSGTNPGAAPNHAGRHEEAGTP